MKLLPCLKCGSENIKLSTWYCGDNPNPLYRYECENCDAWDCWHDTEEEAISEWNTRINYGDKK